MRQRKTEDCGHMIESGIVSIHWNWLIGPRTGFCGIWLSIKYILGHKHQIFAKISYSKINFSFTSMNNPSLHHLSVDTIWRLLRSKLHSKANKLPLTLPMLDDQIRFCGQYRHLTENSGLWFCSWMNQSWREVDFWMMFFAKIWCFWPQYAF